MTDRLEEIKSQAKNFNAGGYEWNFKRPEIEWLISEVEMLRGENERIKTFSDNLLEQVRAKEKPYWDSITHVAEAHDKLLEETESLKKQLAEKANELETMKGYQFDRYLLEKEVLELEALLKVKDEILRYFGKIECPLEKCENATCSDCRINALKKLDYNQSPSVALAEHDKEVRRKVLEEVLSNVDTLAETFFNTLCYGKQNYHRDVELEGLRGTIVRDLKLKSLSQKEG